MRRSFRELDRPLDKQCKQQQILTEHEVLLVVLLSTSSKIYHTSLSSVPNLSGSGVPERNCLELRYKDESVEISSGDLNSEISAL